MRHAVAVILGLLLYLIAPVAKSQTWLICESCQSVSDFEQAALAETPPVPNSWYMYAVGNPNTTVFRYVEVTTYREGEVPMAVYPKPMAAESVASSATASDSYSDSDRSLSSEVLYSVVSIAASPEELTMFASNVKFALVDAVAPPPTNPHGFDSFASAEMSSVSSYLWAFKTALDPNWQSENVGLLGALRIARGKGPTACQVFTNGDSACYQLNPMDKNAARYISGTAKTLTGVLIDGSQVSGGSVGNGDPLHTVQTNPNQYRWSNGSSSTGWLWLICTTQGGQLLECSYIFVPNQ